MKGVFIMQNKPIIYQPGVVPQEIYSGVPSFMGLPVAKTAEDVKNFDFIYAQIKNLRKKLKDAGALAELKAVYGFGYKMTVE